RRGMRKCGDILHDRAMNVNASPSAIYDPSTNVQNSAPRRTSIGTSSSSYRLLGLAVQALARRFLSARAADERVARVLCLALRHRRGEQLVLSAAGSAGVRGM